MKLIQIKNIWKVGETELKHARAPVEILIVL